MKTTMKIICPALALVALVSCRCLAREMLPPGPGWESLFNGRDLTGWIIPPPGEKPWQTATWKVVDGSIDCSGGSRTLISQKPYGDLTLRFQWRWRHHEGKPLPMKTITRIKKDGTREQERVIAYDSGVFLRGETLEQYVNRKGTDLIGGPIQVNLWAVASGSGNIDVGPALKKADRPLGQWNDMEITCADGKVSVVLNGEQVVKDHPIPRHAPPRGHLHLQAHGGDSFVQFRNLWIKALSGEVGG